MSSNPLDAYYSNPNSFVRVPACAWSWGFNMSETYKQKYDSLIRLCKYRENMLEQKIAEALGGFPRYCDDQTNFPGSTAKDGFCVGELVLEDLLDTLISRYHDALNEQNKCTRSL